MGNVLSTRILFDTVVSVILLLFVRRILGIFLIATV